MKWRISGFTGFAILLLSVLPLLGQGSTSGISGVVRDQSGAVLPGVSITVKNVDTGIIRMTVSDNAGRYHTPLLDLGQYEILAELAGFKAYVRGGITLTLDREAVINITMSVGEISERVTVTGEAPLVDTRSSGLGGLVSEKTINDLPLNGRDYIQLATLEAGITQTRTEGGGSTNTGQGVHLSVAGSRTVQNNFRLDGTSVSDQTGGTIGSINGVNLGVDAIREFNVLKSSYSAQYGRSAGGVVSVASRSGTNEFHGTLFYFHRNDNLDAREFFDVGRPPEFKRHQFGGSLGGPIIPDRTFFFGNYEGLRQIQGNTTINNTLSDDARQGKLLSGTVPVDPNIAELLPFYPRPNGKVFGNTGEYIFENNVVAGEDYYTGRIDHQFRESDALFGRYTLDNANRLSNRTFNLGESRDHNRSQYFTADEKHIFSPSMINSARFGFTRSYQISGYTTAPAELDAEPGFIPGLPMGLVAVPGLTQFPGGSGGTDYDRNAYNSFQFYDDLTWIRGGHTVQIGGVIERIHFNATSTREYNGRYDFGSLPDFLTNRSNSFAAQLPGSDNVRGWRQWLAGWYIQDDWKVSNNLTLNLGLRHEFITVPTEVNGKVANMDNVSDSKMRVGDPFFNNPSLLNFGPRVGFAWDPFGQGKTSVRGGYGIFFDQLMVHFLIVAGNRNPPFFLRSDTKNLPQGAFPTEGYEILSTGGPSGTLVAVERIPKDVDQSYVQQWNLNIQQTLGREFVATVGYAGSHGLHLTAVVEDTNLAIPTILPDGRRYFPTGQSKRNPYFAMIRDRLFDGQSFYHGLQLGVAKRFTQGFRLQGSYTFSKNIDDDATTTIGRGEANNAVSIPVDGDFKYNRGHSRNDVSHNFVFNATLNLPSPPGGALKAVFGGWQAGAIVSYSSGQYFTPVLGSDRARTLSSRPTGRNLGQRPDLAPGGSLNPITGDPNRWYDPTAFAWPEAGFLGNVGVGTMKGPDHRALDGTLIKQIPLNLLGEGARIDFRAEFFNMLNNVNFGLPSETVFDSRGRIPEAAGRITSSGSARQIQFGLKLYF